MDQNSCLAMYFLLTVHFLFNPGRTSVLVEEALYTDLGHHDDGQGHHHEIGPHHATAVPHLPIVARFLVLVYWLNSVNFRKVVKLY